MPDYAICRNIDGIFTKQLELLGVKVFNNSFISDICNHKAKTHQYLARFNIPMLDTYFFKKDEFVPENLNLKYPLVIKEVDGRGGKQVYKAEGPEELKKLIESLNCRDIIVQSLGEVPGRDVRVFVVGKRIVAAILRRSDVDFRANFSLGGSAGLYKLTEKQEKLVNEIIDKFEFGMVGIDFIFNKNGDFLFNEIEDVVGSRTLSKNSDINIVKIYLEHIKEQMKSAQ
jgi:RimK family alpha-L-glutamate ligase